MIKECDRKLVLYDYYVDPPGTIVANDFNNYIGKRLSDEKFEALISNCILPSTFKFLKNRIWKASLALMNVHSDILLDTAEIINTFAMKHPRRMKFENILEDVE